MPSNIPLIKVPTILPRCSGLDRVAAKGIKTCATVENSPVMDVPIISIHKFFDKALTISPQVDNTIKIIIKCFRSNLSPRGVIKSKPTA